MQGFGRETGHVIPMKTLAYALAAGLLVLLVPIVHADDECRDPPCPDEIIERIKDYPHCIVFGYSLEPPYYYLNPGCLFPLP